MMQAVHSSRSGSDSGCSCECIVSLFLFQTPSTDSIPIHHSHFQLNSKVRVRPNVRAALNILSCLFHGDGSHKGRTIHLCCFRILPPKDPRRAAL